MRHRNSPVFGDSGFYNTHNIKTSVLFGNEFNFHYHNNEQSEIKNYGLVSCVPGRGIFCWGWFGDFLEKFGDGVIFALFPFGQSKSNFKEHGILTTIICIYN